MRIDRTEKGRGSKYPLLGCLILILITAWLLVGCGKPQADESAGKADADESASREAPEYEPEALANAKADMLAGLIETERRLARTSDRLDASDNLTSVVQDSIRTRLDDIETRAESFYQSARGVSIPRPGGDLTHFRDQVRTMNERRRSMDEDLDLLSGLLAQQARYEKQLIPFLESGGGEPAFLRLALPWQGEVLEVSIRGSSERAIAEGDLIVATTLYEFGQTWLERLASHASRERERAQERIGHLAELAEQAIADDHLTTPPGENAAELLQQMRELDPEHPEVLRLYGEVVDRYELLSRQALARGNYRAARSYVARVESLPIADEDRNRFRETSRKAEELARRESLSGRLEAAVEAGRRGEMEELRVQLESLRERAPDDPRVEQIEARYRVMLHQPGRVFSEDLGGGDSPEGPRMIVGPRGTSVVGAQPRRFSLFRRSRKSEEPRHEVDIRYPYAVSRTEITVDQFRAFVEATGYQTEAERVGFSEVFTSAGRTRVVNRNWRHDWLGRDAEGSLPVVHVSWDDAQAFTEWLSQQTGQRYRLPSEAEFEVLARSKREGDYYWSEENGPEPFSGNFLGGKDQPPREWGSQRTDAVDDELVAYEDGSFGPASVGRYPANDFGFNDLIGNVAEWTQDCAHEDHSGSPGDGRARDSSGDCQRRVVRGGSWISDHDALRLSHRRLRPRNGHDSATGFRVAMDFKTGWGEER